MLCLQTKHTTALLTYAPVHMCIPCTRRSNIKLDPPGQWYVVIMVVCESGTWHSAAARPALFAMCVGLYVECIPQRMIAARPHNVKLMWPGTWPRACEKKTSCVGWHMIWKWSQITHNLSRHHGESKTYVISTKMPSQVAAWINM